MSVSTISRAVSTADQARALVEALRDADHGGAADIVESAADAIEFLLERVSAVEDERDALHERLRIAEKVFNSLAVCAKQATFGCRAEGCFVEAQEVPL